MAVFCFGYSYSNALFQHRKSNQSQYSGWVNFLRLFLSSFHMHTSKISKPNLNINCISIHVLSISVWCWIWNKQKNSLKNIVLKKGKKPHRLCHETNSLPGLVFQCSVYFARLHCKRAEHMENPLIHMMWALSVVGSHSFNNRWVIPFYFIETFVSIFKFTRARQWNTHNQIDT